MNRPPQPAIVAVICRDNGTADDLVAELKAVSHGFFNEMLEIMSQAIPSRTIVPERHLTALRFFTGSMGIKLEASLPALEGWFFSHPAVDHTQPMSERS